MFGKQSSKLSEEEKKLFTTPQLEAMTEVEMIELPGHPWFIGCQFHPEFTSTPRAGHPLFNAFVRAAAANAKGAPSASEAAPKLKSIA